MVLETSTLPTELYPYVPIHYTKTFFICQGLFYKNIDIYDISYLFLIKKLPYVPRIASLHARQLFSGVVSFARARRKKQFLTVFSRLPSAPARKKHLWRMKSLRDEICLAAGDEGGFNFI